MFSVKQILAIQNVYFSTLSCKIRVSQLLLFFLRFVPMIHLTVAKWLSYCVLMTRISVHWYYLYKQMQ